MKHIESMEFYMILIVIGFAILPYEVQVQVVDTSFAIYFNNNANDVASGPYRES